MRRPQFSIAGLAWVILVAAFGLAAIRSGSEAWSGAMFSIMAFAMISSLLGVALARGARQVYWMGFATLGWSYLLLIYVPWLYENVGQFLLARNLFDAIEQVLHPEKSVAVVSLGGFRSMAFSAGGGMSGGRIADLTPFQRIGVALEALLWAFLGGWAARYFASGRDPAAVAIHSATATQAETPIDPGVIPVAEA